MIPKPLTSNRDVRWSINQYLEFCSNENILYIKRPPSLFTEAIFSAVHLLSITWRTYFFIQALSHMVFVYAWYDLDDILYIWSYFNSDNIESAKDLVHYIANVFTKKYIWQCTLYTLRDKWLTLCIENKV